MLQKICTVYGSLWFLLLAVATVWGITEISLIALPKICLAAFYVCLWYLIASRPPARSEAKGLLPRIMAFVGTYMPWFIPFLSSNRTLPVASSLCFLLGTMLMLWTICHLGRSFSLVPQARSVVRTGPYRWLRHPLYLSEEIAILGTVLNVLTPLSLVIFLVHLGVQVSRMYYEEGLLRRSLPDYSGFAAGRYRLVPLVW